jgi:hypothetical protein
MRLNPGRDRHHRPEADPDRISVEELIRRKAAAVVKRVG